MTLPRYLLTAHAVVAMAKRKIEPAWIDRVLSDPERTEPDKADATLTHALGRIIERDDRMLRVIYNASVSPPLIVSVFFDRRLKGKK